jgi:hypothetical protein
MDDIVKKAMAKWPNVPDCFGWLGLDSRGQWHMRDDGVQAIGPFQSGVLGSKGDVLRHEKLVDFIGRNYDCDAQGRWFFQNGPQRVYIELEITPHIWRIEEGYTVTSHTGIQSDVQECLEDEKGRVYLQTTRGLGLVHSLDVLYLAQALELGIWRIQTCPSDQIPVRYGFVLSPQQAAKAAQAKKQ